MFIEFISNYHCFAVFFLNKNALLALMRIILIKNKHFPTPSFWTVLYVQKIADFWDNIYTYEQSVIKTGHVFSNVQGEISIQMIKV